MCRSAPGAGPSSAALAAAESRIEELLDERCDMEYELEVMERKVELLREEVRQNQRPRLACNRETCICLLCATWAYGGPHARLWFAGARMFCA